ncbi:CheR family methyltransferase [Campylobacter aviculae]|uniref:Chemotaxis protein CheR n=1 Tax=Campylobacter aviculae TaxID=2510190 RepID=A0A4U7BQ26_9BACT|nr:CheR family methyltransferase [Campylobacter aviculae]TKX32340.1 chemotaxis protein CheR [Campylobacter aviculae]
MEERIKPTELELNEFIQIINEISGIDLNEKRNILLLKLSKFVSGVNVKTFRDFLDKLKINRHLRQETLDFVTIGETYFLRELTQLKEIIFYAKSLERHVNILSAPCSSGEEVYSMAMLAAQNFMKDMLILGIDINSNVVEKAKLGQYQGRTLQNLSESEKRRFFTCDDNQIFTINKNELCKCKFELCNVFEDKFLRLGKFDIIASRNMIIYFDHESKLKLMERFYQILADKGRLYVGSADLVPETIFFKKVFSSHGVYYEKI